MLDRRCIELICQYLENRLATSPVVGLDSDLDKAVRIECSVSFFFYSGCQAVRADHDDGVQVVRLGALVFALGGGKLYLSHVLIIGDLGTF